MNGPRRIGRTHPSGWTRAVIVGVFVLLCGSSEVGVARAAAAPFGIRAGASGARLHGSLGEDVGSDYRAGFNLGLWRRVPLRPGLAFQPELQWITKGGQGDFTIGIADVHAEFTLHYIEAPLLLRLEIPATNTWTPFVTLGPTIAWRVDSDVDLRFEDIVIPASATHLRYAAIFEDAGPFDDPDFSDWDFGVLGGAGVAIGAGRMRVLLEARYERGFVDLYDADDAEATTGTFAATVGVEVR